MPHIPAWKTFRRTQDLTVLIAGLIYTGAVAHAFNKLPADPQRLSQHVLIWPAGFLAAALLIPLLVGPIRRPLARYVWATWQAGFGQTVGSILGGVALLGGAAGFMYWQISGAATGGRPVVGVFCGYAAGIGILAAQAALVRVLERHPDVRKQIEAPD
jgi:hypothetical protein